MLVLRDWGTFSQSLPDQKQARPVHILLIIQVVGGAAVEGTRQLFTKPATHGGEKQRQ